MAILFRVIYIYIYEQNWMTVNQQVTGSNIKIIHPTIKSACAVEQGILPKGCPG